MIYVLICYKNQTHKFFSYILNFFYCFFEILLNKLVVIVLPAYNASKTLIQTFEEIPMDIVDEIVFVDDNSSDNTIEVAKGLGIKHIINKS